MLALDISVYTGEVFGYQLQAANDAGYKLVIVGLWHGQSANRYAEQQIKAVLDNNLLDGYYVLIAPPTWTPHSPTGQVMIGGAETINLDVYPFRLLAVDAEVDITPDMLLEALIEARGWGKTCIYTGAWWWNFFILRYHDWFYAHPDAFANEPSWLADYDWLPVLDTPRLAHLGPVVGKQFKGTTREIGGINADLNVFDPEFVLGDEEEEEKTMPTLVRIIHEGVTRPEVYELIGDTLYHIPDPTDFNFKKYDWDTVQDLPWGDPVWKQRVVYPAGVPVLMTLPGIS